MQSEQISSLAKALAEAQKSMGMAKKEADNPFFKSKYADLKAVSEACYGPLLDNEIAVWQGVLTLAERQVLATRLMHSSGEWIESHIPLILPKKDMQALGSAITYARRYGLAAAAGVIQEDDDGNGSVLNNDKLHNVTIGPPSGGSSYTGEAGSYVVSFGKFKGMALGNIKRNDIESYVRYLKQQELKDKKPMSGKAKEFCEQVDKYLASGSGQPSDEPPPFTDEDIPF